MLAEEIKGVKTAHKRQAAEQNTKRVTVSTQTNELHRELNSLKRELENMDKQTATQKEMSIASEVTDERNNEPSDTTNQNRMKKVF